MHEIATLLGFGPGGWSDEIAYGALVTGSLALATLPLGLVAGFCVALAKRSDEASLRLAGHIYTTIFRGLPELLTLFVVFHGGQIAAGHAIALFDPDKTIEINAFAAGMIALGAVFSAYCSEVFLSAFRAIPRGQYEGAYAIGLSRTQAMRLVIAPQLLRLALPGLSNLWLNLLKDTALVSVIGLSDILRQAGIAARVTSEALLFYGLACLVYLVLAMMSSVGLHALERSLRRHEAVR